ncbi:MAG TPA: hypothetical protein H9701_02295 [Candidatus Intestinimonas pullistercoris]|uniref:Uncharacterized protein n=1 Tax=Candidatus Intestinimonas pullistercoris TaxID=2838623 RepID=A0A9D2P0U6_9FIRM|nr:hypothetical protein [Candidatus Intestinimonas pullistercoris]
MDKKKLPAVAAGIALAALVWLNWVHFDQINRLYGEVNELQDGLNDLKEDYRRAMDSQRLLLQEGLEREASLFSRAETSLSYDNGMLVLEAAVVPKELRAGETALLTLDTGESAPLTDDGTGWLRGSLSCSVQEQLVPVVTLSTQESTRREALPEMWTEELLTYQGTSQWACDAEGLDSILMVTLKPYHRDGPRQVAEVWVEVRYAALDPEAPSSLAGRVQAVQDAEGTWRADLGDHIVKGETYDYACYLTVELEGGLELTSLDPAAEQSWEGNSGHSSSGDCYLRPSF